MCVCVCVYAVCVLSDLFYNANDNTYRTRTAHSYQQGYTWQHLDKLAICGSSDIL